MCHINTLTISRVFRRLLKTFPLLLYTCLCLPVRAQAGDLPDFFEASYTLHSKGTQFAEMKRSFSEAANGEYIFRSETRTTGFMSLFRKDRIIEESRWAEHEPQLRPLHYLYQHTGGKKKRSVNITFNWEDNKVTNQIGDSNWSMPLQQNTLDKLLYQFAIMRDLSRDTLPQSYTIADGGKIKVYEFKKLGNEAIHTPLGDLQTIKLARYKPGSKDQTLLWCAINLDYLPIKVENTEKDGQVTTAIIKALKGLRN